MHILLKKVRQFFCNHKYEDDPEVLREANEKYGFEEWVRLAAEVASRRSREEDRILIESAKSIYYSQAGTDEGPPVAVTAYKYKGQLCALCGRKRVVKELMHKQGNWLAVLDAGPLIGAELEVVVL